jgi:hypothetical protein
MENTMSNLEGGRPPRMPKPKPPKVRTKRFSGAKHKFRKTFSTGRSGKIRRTLKSRGVHKPHIKSRRRNPLRRKTTLKVKKSELYAAQQKQQYKVAKSQAGLNVASNSMKKRQGSIATTSSDLQGAKERKKQQSTNLKTKMKNITASKNTRDKKKTIIENQKKTQSDLKKEIKKLKKSGNTNLIDIKKSAIESIKSNIVNQTKALKTTKKTLKTDLKATKSLESNLKRTKKVEKAHEKSLKKDQKQLKKNSKTFDKAEKRLTKSKNTSEKKLSKRLKEYTKQVNKQQKKFVKKKQSYKEAVALTKGKRFFNPSKYFGKDAKRARAMRKTAKKLSQSGKYGDMTVDNLMRRNNVMKTAMKSRKKGNFKTYLKNSENGSNQNLIRNSQITLGETKSIKNQALSQKQSADDFAKYARLKRKERTNEKRMSNGTEGKRQYELNKGTLGRQGRKYQRSLKRQNDRILPQTAEKVKSAETEISRIQQINKYKKERENDFQTTQDLSEKTSNKIAELRRQHRQTYASKNRITKDNASKYIKGDNRKRLAEATKTQQQMARLSINGELTKTSDIKSYDTSKFSSLKEKALRVDFFKARGWDKKKYGKYKALKEKALSGKKLNSTENQKYITFLEERNKLKEEYQRIFPKSTPSQSP